MSHPQKQNIALCEQGVLEGKAWTPSAPFVWKEQSGMNSVCTHDLPDSDSQRPREPPTTRQAHTVTEEATNQRLRGQLSCPLLAGYMGNPSVSLATFHTAYSEREWIQ